MLPRTEHQTRDASQQGEQSNQQAQQEHSIASSSKAGQNAQQTTAESAQAQQQAVQETQDSTESNTLLVVQMSEVNHVIAIDRENHTITVQIDKGDTVQLLVPDALLQALQL